MRRQYALVLLTLALLLFGSEVEGASPRWKIGGNEVARYRIEADKKVQKQYDYALRMPGALPLTTRSFLKGIRYAEPINDLSGIVLHYAFSIPKGKKSKGAILLTDTFQKVPPYQLNIQTAGRAKIKNSGNKARIEGQLKLGQAPGQNPNYAVTQGHMKWTTVFDTKQGAVLTSNYDFSIEYNIKSQPGRIYKYSGTGRIILVEKAERSPEKLRKEVAIAIKNGAKWLHNFTKGGGVGGVRSNARMGYIAISLFALLRSGIPNNDPVIVDGFKTLAKLPIDKTYDVSLYIMALEARSITRNPPVGGSTIPRYDRGRIAKADLAKIQQLANWLVSARNINKGTWHYGSANAPAEGKPRRPAGGYDNSNTQFAVLALHAAHRVGAKIDPVVWHEIFEHFLSIQCQPSGQGKHVISRSGEKPGEKGKKSGGTVSRGQASRERGVVPYRGWSYSAPSRAYGSMTNAGLSSIAIAADMLKGHKKLTAKQQSEFYRMVAEGLFWQAANFSVTGNPGQSASSWYYYYMYSLEKACELLGVEAFDGRDWFLEGAEHLVALQNSDGSWNNSQSDTALALLFLNRATLRSTVNILPGRTATGVGPADPKDRATVLLEKAGGLVSLTDLLKSLKGTSSRERSKLQRWYDKGIDKLDELIRPIVMPELIALLDQRVTKSWARKRLRDITQDSRLKEADDFTDWHDRWFAMDRAADDHAYERIALLEEVLAKDKNRLLRRLAMLTAVRLMAVELVDVIAPLLDQRKEKALAADCLQVLMGRKPKDRQDAEDWISANGERARAAQKPRRFVAKAARGDKAAQATIIKAGRSYLAELVVVATDAKLGGAVVSMLEKITGEKQKPELWSEWWRSNKDKVGPDGKLPKPKAVKPS